MKTLHLYLVCLGVMTPAACDSDTKSSSAASEYVVFTGNSNMGGTAVVDANGQFVRFLANPRTMEPLGLTTTTDITLDANHNIVKAGNKNIGRVELIAGDSGSSVSAMIATSGKALALQPDGSSTSLTESNVTYAKPGSTTGTLGRSASGTTGTGGDTAAAAAQCKAENYKGPTADPQVDTYCQNAFINKCLDNATGTNTYAQQTKTVCDLLGSMLSASGKGTAASYCSYCK